MQDTGNVQVVPWQGGKQTGKEKRKRQRDKWKKEGRRREAREGKQGNKGSPLLPHHSMGTFPNKCLIAVILFFTWPV